jgi:pSer/pThr/pTyr-binding forkhead associated (FHA) protein
LAPLLGIALLARRRHAGVAAPAAAPAPPAASAAPLARLDITYADGGTKTWKLEPGKHLVGRDPALRWVLKDDQISARHAEVQVTPEGCAVRDLGSSNGTLVNDQKIEAVRLQEGDVITLGTTRLVFRSYRS